MDSVAQWSGTGTRQGRAAAHINIMDMVQHESKPPKPALYLDTGSPFSCTDLRWSERTRKKHIVKEGKLPAQG